MASDAASYIVQVRRRVFFTVLREGDICDTPYPSEATHMTYDVADAVCQKIRSRGNDEAIVCDHRGAPVIASDLEKAQPISEFKVKQFYDDRVTERDWLIFRGISAGEDPKALAARLGLEYSDFAKALGDANRRISDGRS
jgi:hypothetical protein